MIQQTPHLDATRNNEYLQLKMGSYDPTLATFTPTKYLGMTNYGLHVTDFDQTEAVIGASGDWNIYYHISLGIPRGLINIRLPHRHRNGWCSSPKKHCSRFGRFPKCLPESSQRSVHRAKSIIVMISDGKGDAEAVPIQPLLVKAQGLGLTR